jgi:hypothetical protein
MVSTELPFFPCLLGNLEFKKTQISKLKVFFEPSFEVETSSD